MKIDKSHKVSFFYIVSASEMSLPALSSAPSWAPSSRFPFSVAWAMEIFPSALLLQCLSFLIQCLASYGPCPLVGYGIISVS